MGDVAGQPKLQTAGDRQRFGFFHDPSGDLSSKRLLSILAFREAALIPFVAPLVQGYVTKLYGTNINIPTVEICISLLSYSAALQGVAVLNERPSQNTQQYQAQSQSKLYDPKQTLQN